MHYLLGLLALVVSLSAVWGSSDDYTSLEEIKDGSTYEFDSFKRKFYRTSTKSCTEPGPMCDDCKTLYICIQMGAGYIKEKLEDCSPGTCLESAAACTTAPNPACNDDGIGYNFTCHQAGIFPDPFDCQKYHFCVPDGTEEGAISQSIVKRCSGSYYYDPRTTLCRKRLNNVCPIIVPPCAVAGQSGVIPNNPAMYYICLKGPDAVPFPNLFYCPDGMVFELVSRTCVSAAGAPPAGADGKCLKVGKFWFPFSCLYYYDCPYVGNAPFSTRCEDKMRFDHISQQCVDFTCDDVDY